ncbi:MAG: response regulator transcription factor [Promicromonosporaceae bacterium]|nr:response regulator transcription factor [Promicromonosporaceae bacterium]
MLTDRNQRATPIKVLVVDDHPMMRAGVMALLARQPQIEVVGEAANGREAVVAAIAYRPDVVLMDLRMPEMGGVEATAEIVAKGDARTRVLILTTYDTDSDIILALEAGAAGFVLKEVAAEALVRAVEQVAAGQRPLSDSVAARLSDETRVARLTERELAVLRLAAAGQNNTEIGQELMLTTHTVKTYMTRAFKKLSVSDRTTAVLEARRRGWLP